MAIRPKTYQDALREGEKKRGGLSVGNVVSDFKMAIGLKPKTGLFNLQTRRSLDRRQDILADMKERRDKKNRRKRRRENTAQKEARLKQEALEKRKAEGQERRKKFYKEKGERLAKLKAKLLNLV